MYTRIALSLAPAVEDSDVAIDLADIVCEYLSMTDSHAIADAVRPESFDDAVELLLDDEVMYPPSKMIGAALVVLEHAGVTDFDSADVSVETGDLFVGSPVGFSRIDKVSCGDWEAEFGAWGFAISKQGINPSEGFYRSEVIPAGDVAGVWTDPSVVGEAYAAFGPGISLSGLTFEPASDTLLLVQHVNGDGLIDGVFCYEEQYDEELDVPRDVSDPDIFP
jgi:hypothetical protein